MHFTLYRDYILDGFKSSKGIFVDEIEKNKFSDFVYYIQYDAENILKKKYLVGFIVNTINGDIEVSVYNQVLGNLKNKLHQELINKFQKFRLSLVYNLDLPYDILNMIEGYLN
jgi:hypothetical protein